MVTRRRPGAFLQAMAASSAWPWRARHNTAAGPRIAMGTAAPALQLSLKEPSPTISRNVARHACLPPHAPGDPQMMKILVLGGAGYIGSHMVRYLRECGDRVTVFDNLSTGHRMLAGDTDFVEGDILDAAALATLFADKGPFDAVIHFCARSLVGESVTDPALYYRNNVAGTLNVLDAMRATGHRRLVFSSSAAVYGIPSVAHIDEQQPTTPINPYGRTKLVIEQLLADCATAYGIDSVSLRYFNAAGAHPAGDIGELHEPETHLVPNVLRAALGLSALKVFGNDYPTTDGSCVRDYVHVCDLAVAHRLAISYMKAQPGAHVFNLGNGSGFSVFEVIRAAEQVTGRKITYELAPRRAGDPPRLVADAARARRELGWQPAWTDIGRIIDSAWLFMRNPDRSSRIR